MLWSRKPTPSRRATTRSRPHSKPGLSSWTRTARYRDALQRSARMANCALSRASSAPRTCPDARAPRTEPKRTVPMAKAKPSTARLRRRGSPARRPLRSTPRRGAQGSRRRHRSCRRSAFHPHHAGQGASRPGLRGRLRSPAVPDGPRGVHPRLSGRCARYRHP